MTRALLVTSSFPRHAQDAAGAFLLPLLHALQAQGLSTQVLAPHARGATAWMPGLHHARYAPVSWERLFYGAGAPTALRTRGLLGWPLAVSAVAALAWEIRRLNPEVVYAHWLVPGALAAALSGIPFVAYAHGSDVTLLEQPALAPLARWVAAQAHALCAPAHTLARRVENLCHQPCHTLPLPVEVPAPGKHVRTHDVGYLGRLVEGKGTAVLLEACALGNKSVLLGGDGPLRFALEAQAKRWHVRATFAGWVPPQERGDFFNRVGVMAVPSVAKEGSPMVLWEACAHGVPLVAAAVEGIAGQWDEAFCVPPGDAKALAAMLEVALSDETWNAAWNTFARAIRAERSLEALGPAHANVLREAARSAVGRTP